MLALVCLALLFSVSCLALAEEHDPVQGQVSESSQESSGEAQVQESSGETQAPKRVLRVAFAEVEGLTEKDEDGSRHGVVVDYLNEIAKYTGWEYEYIDTTGETMTANTFKEDADAAEAAGMDGFVTKPVDVGYLYQVLGQAVKHRRPGQPG